jgi:glycine dehydrogenase subunit 1
LSLRFDGAFFKEFVIDLEVDAEEFVLSALDENILAGVPLGRFYPDLKTSLLIGFTEKRTRAEIDALVSLMENAGGGGKTT